MKQFIVVVLLFSLISLPTKSFADTTIQLSPLEEQQMSKGDVVIREIPTPKMNGKTFTAFALVNSDIDSVYNALTQFENHNQFMPNVKEVEILEKDLGRAVINYTLKLPMNQTKRYRLMTSFKKNKDNAMIVWKKIEWPELKKKETIKDTEGYWLIKKLPKEKNQVMMIYHVHADPGKIPFFLKWIVDILTKESIPETLRKTREYVNSLFK